MKSYFNCYKSYSRYAENVNESEILVSEHSYYNGKKSVRQDKIYRPCLRTENISCMGGAANASFQEVCNCLNFTNTAWKSSVWIRQ